MIITKYSFDVSFKYDSSIMMVINHEKLYRFDHLNQFRFIRDALNEKLNSKINYFEIKRVINWNIFELVYTIIVGRTFYSIIHKQLDKVIESLKYEQYRKIVVFCDTVPLQNYLCHYYNNIGIDTYSLQHGFYISDENKSFELVYKSSNSKNFFIWDKRTLKYMSKHVGEQERIFIKAGPISKSFYSISNKKNASKSKEIKKIAIYGCGKDQVEQNLYLIDFYRYLKEKLKYEVAFICHPIFNSQERRKLKSKHKLEFYPTNKKSEQYDLHLVLNSGVWLELEEREERYSLLNEAFTNKVSISETCDKLLIEGVLEQHNELNPFFRDQEVLNILANEIINYC